MAFRSQPRDRQRSEAADGRGETPLEHAGRTEEALRSEDFLATAESIERAVATAVVGQTDVVRGVLICLIAGGHALLEGVPGVGKTTIARAFASALGLSHSRIQFTPDLMPADITGTTVLHDRPSGPEFTFEPGPVFASLVLADEINRAAPRTQSALLEAMQERQVTVSGATRLLPRPFCVLATQNPAEMHGTYPLPEAQLDRFLLRLTCRYPRPAELGAIIAGGSEVISPATHQVADARLLVRMNALALTVPVATHVVEYMTRLVLALQPSEATPVDDFRQYLALGPSPRGGRSLAVAARVSALLDGRMNVAFQDIRDLAVPSLSHRLVLTIDAHRDGVSAEEIVKQALTELER